MSIWRKQGGLIGKPGGNNYPSSGLWDVADNYIKNNIIPEDTGEIQYITPGTYTFTVPATGISSVSVVCVGAGGGGLYYSSYSSSYSYRMNGGGGGGLVYVPALAVTPGQSFSITVGAGGQSGSYSTGSTIGGASVFGAMSAGGGYPGRYNSSISGGSFVTGYLGASGRSGGWAVGSPQSSGYGPAGGGGAAGYTSNGGYGWNRNPSGRPATYVGDGGGGGGWTTSYFKSFAGGGVGMFGAGANGVQGEANVQALGGSGGTAASGGAGTTDQLPGLYGGGGGGNSSSYSGTAGDGGQGVVRVIFGTGRAFPSTNTDLSSSNGNVTIF